MGISFCHSTMELIYRLCKVIYLQPLLLIMSINKRSKIFHTLTYLLFLLILDSQRLQSTNEMIVYNKIILLFILK